MQCEECGARTLGDSLAHKSTCSRVPMAATGSMPGGPTSAAERTARIAWLMFLNSQIDGGTTHEMVDETRTTLEALPEERGMHETWRNVVVGAVEKTLREFLPPLEVTDESPSPSEPDETTTLGRNRGIGVPAPRATIAELGYFETVGRSLGVLPNAQRIRVLIACLVAYAFEADIPPVELSMMVTRTARRYFARLKHLSSPAPYDGHGLIGYAFPPDKP